MSFWRDLLGLDAPALAESAATFETDGAELIGGADIDPAVFGLGEYGAANIARAPKVDRRLALQVPAVKRSHDLVPGVLGTLPLQLYGPDRQPVEPSPFDQPERNVPRSVSMTRLFGDLFFDTVAWWHVTETDYRDYPMYFKRLAPRRVTVDEYRDLVMVDGRVDDPKTGKPWRLIRFDSPTQGLLEAGARAIRTCLLLDSAAANAADGVPPIQYFTPADGAEDLDPDEIKETLDNWQDVRRGRATGFVPASLKLVDAGWDPEKLQLIEQREHAVLDIARVAGVDPEELGVSTTSRTYANTFDRRKNYTDFTLGIYRQAVEDRLAMGDVTPRGTYAKFNLDAFLRSDPKSRYEAYAAGLAVNALDQDDIDRLEDRPSSDTTAPIRAVTALPTRTEETA